MAALSSLQGAAASPLNDRGLRASESPQHWAGGGRGLRKGWGGNRQLDMWQSVWKGCEIFLRWLARDGTERGKREAGVDEAVRRLGRKLAERRLVRAEWGEHRAW